MVAAYFVLVVLYFLFGYLFLPDEICATGLYFLGSLLFPVAVFMVVGVLIHKGIIKVPPVSETAPPEPEEEVEKKAEGTELPPPVSAPISPAPSTPYEILCSVDSMSGYDFEQWCAKLLRRLLFSSVEVTKSSGDQGVDVLAKKGGVRYAIQCKCYSSDIGNHSVQEVHAGKSMYNCHVGVVMTNRYFTPAAKELARVTGTLLWDRDALLEMLESLDQ